MNFDSKWLLAGLFYFIGAFSTFIVKFVQSIQRTGHLEMKAFGWAWFDGLLWPFELLLLFL